MQLQQVFSLNLFSQTPIDGYKYAYVEDPMYDNGIADFYGIAKEARDLFKKLRIIVIEDNNLQDFLSRKNPCELLTVSNISHVTDGWRSTVTIDFTNCLGNFFLNLLPVPPANIIKPIFFIFLIIIFIQILIKIA